MQRQLSLEGSIVAARSNLVSVPIIDKNGVWTRRWMRPESEGSNSAGIPAVSSPASPVPAQATRKEIQAKELARLPLSLVTNRMVWNGLKSKHSVEHVVNRYINLPEETRECIARASLRDESLTTTSSMIFLKMLVGSNTSDQMIDDVATYIDRTDMGNFGFIMRMYRTEDETEVQYQPLKIDITGLKYYSLNGFSYDSSLPIRQQSETTQEQIDALFKLHSYSYSLPSYMETGREPAVTITANNRIEPYWLAQYAVEHPNLVDNMINIIAERGTAREDVIRPILSAESPAMMHGVL